MAVGKASWLLAMQVIDLMPRSCLHLPPTDPLTTCIIAISVTLIELINTLPQVMLRMASCRYTVDYLDIIFVCEENYLTIIDFVIVERDVG